jgi:hypothetical protein
MFDIPFARPFTRKEKLGQIPRKQPVRRMWPGPYLEVLEDRTLLNATLGSTFPTFFNGLSQLQGGISSILNSVSGVPFINQGNLQGTFGSLKDAQVLSQKLITDVENLPYDPNTIAQEIQTDIFSVLGPGTQNMPGLNLLAADDGKGEAPTATNSVIITPRQDGSFDVEMRFHLTVAQRADNQNLQLGLGLPGIPFKVEVSGNPIVNVGFDYEFAFTLNPNAPSLTVNAKPVLQGNDPYDGHQMSLHVTVTLPAPITMKPFAKVIVGFLEGTIDDHQGKTKLGVDFNLDGLDPSNPNLGGIKPSISGQANLDLDLTGGFAGDTNPPQFPSIKTEFVLTWGFDTANQNDPINLPQVAFNDVQVQFGSLMDGILGPLLGEIQKVTEPLEPIVKLLKAPIPGLSDLSHAAGGGDISLETLAKDAALLDPGLAQYADFVSQLVDIIDTVNSAKFGSTEVWITLGNFNLSGNGDLRSLPIAPDPTNLNLNDLTQTSLTSLVATYVPNIPGLQSVANQLGNVVMQGLQGAQQVGVVLPVLDQLMQPNGISFQFPMFQQDYQNTAFALLMGEDVPFVTFNAHYNLPLNVGQSFSAFGLVVSLKANLDIDANLTLGYDTYGIREFLQDRKPTDFLDGLYIDETPMPNGNSILSSDPQYQMVPTTHLSIAGSASAGLGAGIIPGVSVTINVGLFTGPNINDPESHPIVLTLHDPENDNPKDGNPPVVDHKLRTSEIEDDINNINNIKDLCGVFDVKGELTASVFIEVSAGFNSPWGFVGYDHKFDLGSATLLDFDNSGCDSGASQSPELAGFDPNTPGQLDLYTGAFYSKLSGVNDMTGRKETFEVSHLGGTRGDETVAVTAFGYTQTFQHVNTIFADGTGDVSDNITVDSGVLDDATLKGGGPPFPINPAPTDTLTYLGSGIANITGGLFKNNQLELGPQTDTGPRVPLGLMGTFCTLTGGGIDNVLIGGGGADVLDCTNSAGTETLIAGPGDSQKLMGGAGTNNFYAGHGNNCQMLGGSGTNFFNWQEGNGTITVTGQGNNQGQNTLTVIGTQPGESVTAGGPFALSVILVSPSNQVLFNNQPTDIQVLNLDDPKGNAAYTINDLSRTGIENVNVNMHEDGAPDRTADSVTENVASFPATVTVDAATVDAGRQNGNNPPQELYGQLTSTQVVVNDPSVVLLPYRITTAIPNTTDQLTINTTGGPDTITVHATQSGGSTTDPVNEPLVKPGGKVTVNTANGNDNLDIGFYTLDNFFGPLYLYAQAGSADLLTFDESQSLVNDVDRLSATELVRYRQPPTVTMLLPNLQPGFRPQLPETAHPFIFTFQTAGGSFSPGVVFNSTFGGTSLYIPETGANEPVTVNADGQIHPDQIYVGFDGANGPARQSVTIDGITFLPLFPTTPGQSTLAFLASPLTVNGLPAAGAQLEADDETAPAGQTYTLGITNPTTGILQRAGASPIEYSTLQPPAAYYIVFTLNAGNQGNTIAVTGVPADTTATIDAGSGTNTVTVGDINDRLDSVLGPLTINGDKGTDLTINDQGNGQSQVYALSATNLTRQGMAPISITFHDLHSLIFNASAANNDGIQVTGTPADVPVAVDPGPGMGDQLNIVDLDNLKGPLDLKWTQGVKTVVADDTGTQAAQTYTLAANGLVRSRAKPITFSPMTVLVLDVGLSHADVVRVEAITAATQVQINGGKVSTSVLVADSTKNLDAIAGPLAINGAGGAAATTVTLEDQNEPTGRNYVLNQADFQAANLPVIGFSQLTGLILVAGNQGNTITVHGTAAGTHVTVRAGMNDPIQVGDANNTLQGIQGRLDVVGRGPNSRLLINDSGGVGMSSYVLTATELDHAPSAPIGYQSLGKLILTGSTSGVDGYQVKGTPPAGSTAVQIVAGGTDNTLDYSGYSSNSSVVVDLKTGFATGLGGGVSGIQSVIGGSGGPAGTYNLLIGNGGNMLIGHTGRRNILVAGATASTLDVLGSNEEDLLIAGTTQYDTEAGLASWLQIAAYWAGTDPFATRVSKLEAGTGVPKLAAATVKGNGGGNTFLAMGQLVLLYSDGKDVLPFPFFFDPSSKTVTIVP